MKQSKIMRRITNKLVFAYYIGIVAHSHSASNNAFKALKRACKRFNISNAILIRIDAVCMDKAIRFAQYDNVI